MMQLGLIVPCYNEEDVIPETNRRLLELLTELHRSGLIAANSSVCFVDDGSSDRTWELIEGLAFRDPRVRGIRLSRNSGQQKALLTGLFGTAGDALITVDADLQDDVVAVHDMLRDFNAGSDIVCGVRRSRPADTPVKRGTAALYYKLLAWLGVEIVDNHGDFRLMSRRAVDSLSQFSEVNLFLRGLVPLIGFKSSTVHYDRAERAAGTSKYSMGRMLALAVDGVTSFSIVPLRLIAAFGVIVAAFGAVMIAWMLFKIFFIDAMIPSWASSVLPAYFLGGVQLFSVGVVGEYVAKIYVETKRRPRYFIEKVV